MNYSVRRSVGSFAVGPLAALVLLTNSAHGVDLLTENFEGLALGPVVTFESEVRSRAAWTKSVPTGAGVEGVWSIDDSAMSDAVGDALNGAVEFEGWTFVDKDWWINTAGDQDRGQFVSASGKIAVADPDEWDDFGEPEPLGFYDTTLRISSIPLQGVAANTAKLFFHSSWRPEDSQKGSLTVKYNDPGATAIELFRWTSQETDPNFKPDSTNEAISLDLHNPAGATQATLEFRMFDAGNDWWWAVDNLFMVTGAAPAQDGALRLIIDRATQQVKIVNNTNGPVNLRGYSIRSNQGALDEGAATYLGDANSNWQVFDSPTVSELSEGYIPDQYVMPTAASNATLGQINLGPAWRKFNSDISDITFQYLIAGSSTPQNGIVEFTGNGGVSFEPLDLNFNGSIELGDYAAFLAGYNVSLIGKTAAQRYNLGDIDGDGKHTVGDFQLFKTQFNLLRGPGALEALLAAVPEPSSVSLLVLACAGGIAAGRRRFSRKPMLALAAALTIASAAPARANLPLLLENFDDLTLGASPELTPQELFVWNGVGPTLPAPWTLDNSGMPGFGDPANDGMRDFAGWSFVDRDWWVDAAGDQERTRFTKSTGVVMVADSDTWDDANHAAGLFNTFLTTPSITIPAGIPAGKIKLAFDSSWRPEAFDDGDLTNNQTGTIKISYNGGPKQAVLTYDSDPASPNYHSDDPAHWNESVLIDLGYNGTATTLRLEFSTTKAANDWWWAIDNIRVFAAAEPSILKINTTTGAASIIGGDAISMSISSYDISSTNGNLAPTGNVGLAFSKPDSIDGPDADSIVGNAINESWQTGAANANQFAEFFLDGNSAFTTNRTENLGKIFNPATPEAMRDLQFTYTTIFGDVLTGVVQYVAGPAQNADFDSDGDVDGRDFLTWQRNKGTGTTLAQGNADGDGDVDADDLAVWDSQYGPAATATASAAVPEPTGLGLSALALGLLGVVRRRPRTARATAKPAQAIALTAATAAALVAGSATAQSIPAPFVDRMYRMGDSGEPSVVDGGTVSVTWDTAGAANQNQLIDLTAFTKAGGAPKYVTISGRPDGGTGFGINLNPNASDRQFLRTAPDEALNFPEKSPSAIDGTLPGGTLDYRYITDRGFQLWTKPTAISLGHIVMDTNNHGVLLRADGKFAMRYSNFDYPGVTTAVPNTWYHLMVVRPFGPGNGSILYVNGVAEAAAVGGYFGEDIPNDETTPANQDNSPLVVGSNSSESPFQLASTAFYRGVVDDLEMFVMGLNLTSDRGEFKFDRDNDYAAFFKPTNVADLTGDNAITIADVQVFASNWLKEKVLTWTQAGLPRALAVGDLQSRAMGDFNYDGRVNLSDWAILNTANPAMGAAAMALIRGVPEPSALALAGVSAWALGVAGARSRRRSERHRGGSQGVC
ncbi:MAG: PEP-CTERM sorting domain-containing protein [Pirellulales bacterium]|nr:PEP-CTERM sorting domain-containing protein [Pirellulales bacterium]